VKRPDPSIGLPVLPVFVLAAVLAGALLATAAAAADEPAPIDPPSPEVTAPAGDLPDLPPPVVTGEPLQPEVQIRQTPRETVYEYRRNGRLYLVRVQPRVGPPYHFYDFNGDGVLDYRPGEPIHHEIHQWTLFRW
jgi:hypothetical protein